MSHLRLQFFLLQKCISIFWAHVLNGFVAWWFLVPMCDRDTNWMPGFIPSPHQDLHYSLFFPPTLLQFTWEHCSLWCCWQNMQLYNRCSKSCEYCTLKKLSLNELEDSLFMVLQSTSIVKSFTCSLSENSITEQVISVFIEWKFSYWIRTLLCSTMTKEYPHSFNDFYWECGRHFYSGIGSFSVNNCAWTKIRPKWEKSALKLELVLWPNQVWNVRCLPTNSVVFWLHFEPPTSQVSKME